MIIVFLPENLTVECNIADSGGRVKDSARHVIRVSISPLSRFFTNCSSVSLSKRVSNMQSMFFRT